MNQFAVAVLVSMAAVTATFVMTFERGTAAWKLPGRGASGLRVDVCPPGRWRSVRSRRPARSRTVDRPPPRWRTARSPQSTPATGQLPPCSRPVAPGAAAVLDSRAPGNREGPATGSPDNPVPPRPLQNLQPICTVGKIVIGLCSKIRLAISTSPPLKV